MFESGLDNDLLTLDTGLENSAMAAEESTAPQGNPYHQYALGDDGNWYRGNERVYYWVPPAETDSTIGGGSETQGIGQDLGGYYTEAEIKAAYDADSVLGEQTGGWDNYWGFVSERQSEIQAGNLIDPIQADFAGQAAIYASENTDADAEIANAGRDEEIYYAQSDANEQTAFLNQMSGWVDQNAALMNKYGIAGAYQNDDGDVYAFNGSTYSRTYKAEGVDWGQVVAGVMISAFTGAVGASLGSWFAKIRAGLNLPGYVDMAAKGITAATGGFAGAAGGVGSIASDVSGAFNPNVIVNLAGSDYDPSNPNNVQNPDELQNPDQDDLLDRLILTTKTITGIDSPLYEDPDNAGTYYYEDGTVAVQPDPNQPAYNTFYQPDGTEYGYGKTSDYGLIPAAPPESVKDLADPSILDNSTYVIYNPQTGEWINTTIAGQDGKPTSWGGIGNDAYWVVRGADGSLYVTDGTDLEPYRGGISDDPLMNDGVENEFRGRHPLWQHVKNGGLLPGGGEITNGGAVVVPPKDDADTETEDATNTADTESTSPGGGNSTSDSNTGAGGNGGTSGGDATSDSDGTNQAPNNGEVVSADGNGDTVGGEGPDGGEQPAEGDPCQMADGRTGTVKNGVCVFEPTTLAVNPSVWAGDDSTNGGVTDDNNTGGDNNNTAGGDNTTTTDAATPGNTNTGSSPGVLVVADDVWGTGSQGDGNTGTGNGNGNGNGDGNGDGNGGDGGDGGNGDGAVAKSGRGGSNTKWSPLFPGTQFRRFDKRARQGMMQMAQTPNFTADSSRQNLYAGMFSDLMKGKA